MLQFKVAIYCRAGAGAGAEAKNMDKGGAGAENRSFRLRYKSKQNSLKKQKEDIFVRIVQYTVHYTTLYSALRFSNSRN